MKLVLIIPPSPWLMSDLDQPITGPLYISSHLKSLGHDVQVCDLAGLSEENWRIPVGDVYGITGTTPNFPWIKKIASILKERDPNKLVVVGGVHATVLPNHILSRTKADACVVGEGENTMLDLMLGMELEKIPGVVTRKGRGPTRELIKDISKLHHPDRESIDYFKYLVPQTYKYLSNAREGSIITSRGCPYKCSYCGSYNIHKGKVRFREPDDVFLELKYLKDRFDIGLCNFVDDTFTLKKKRVHKICELIKPLGIKWFFLTRVDRVDEDLFKEMKASGCVSVTFGFESGSNKMLKAMRKGTTVEQAKKAIKLSHKVGLKIRGQLMTGLPNETEEDIEATGNFIKESPEVEVFGLHKFQPFPGCDVWENPTSYNFKIDTDTDFEDYHTIGGSLDESYGYLIDIIGERDIKNVA